MMNTAINLTAGTAMLPPIASSVVALLCIPLENADDTPRDFRTRGTQSSKLWLLYLQPCGIFVVSMTASAFPTGVD